MGWQDRDYSTEHPWERWEAEHGSGRRRDVSGPPRTVIVLICIHVAAFVLMYMFESDPTSRDIGRSFGLSAESLAPQGILLHPYSSTSFFSVFLDGLILWTVGSAVIQRCGALSTCCWYVAGNLAAGVAFFGIGRTAPDCAVVPLHAPLGAFSAWLCALYLTFGNEYVMILGKMRRFGLLLALAFGVVMLAAMIFYRLSGFAFIGASLAGLAGAPLGAGLADVLRRVRLPDFRRPMPPRPRQPRRVVRPDEEAAPVERAVIRSSAQTSTVTAPAPSRTTAPDDIDDLLAKISREGIASLTDEERSRLEAARQARLRSR